jgi:transcriptional regulator with XRE-family HTH domain
MPLPVVPTDYDEQLRVLRQQLRLTQGALARRIGAAGKVVVYQWESRRRTPSPVLWQRVLELDRRPARAAQAWDDRAYHGNRFRHLDSRVIQLAETSE